MNGVEISGYNGKYTIFPDGSVRRNPSRFRRETMMLKPKPGRYLRVALYGPAGKKEVSIHRLVATYFIPNPNGLPWVNHKDGNTHNNNASNLEWCTPLENLIHSIDVLGKKRNSLKQRESARVCGLNKRKLSMPQAMEIRAAVTCTSRKTLASRYGVSLSVIDGIVQNKRYVSQ